MSEPDESAVAAAGVPDVKKGHRPEVAASTWRTHSCVKYQDMVDTSLPGHR